MKLAAVVSPCVDIPQKVRGGHRRVNAVDGDVDVSELGLDGDAYLRVRYRGESERSEENERARDLRYCSEKAAEHSTGRVPAADRETIEISESRQRQL